MKNHILTATLLAIFLALPAASFAANPAQITPENLQKLKICAQNATTSNISPDTWMDGNPNSDEIIIDFKDSLSNADAIQLGHQWGLNLKLNSPYADDSNLFIAQVPEGSVPAYAECLKENANIEAIDENFRLKAFAETPNDPLYPFQWNFEQINVEKAWNYSTGKGVVVAVIDTGVALEDDPSRRIRAVKDLENTGRVPGYDFVDNDDFPWDGHGHGTHVAGTIAQSTDNNYGVAGLAHKADIMPLRVLNTEGYGNVSDIADSIRFAADNGAHVINMSLGGPLPSLVMSRAVKYAHNKGVTIVAAAGNSGRREVSYPAAYKHVIAVAATQFDRSTTFYSQWGTFVDIAAPGGNTRVDQNGDGRPDGVMQETLKDSHTDQHEFALYMGTSMASPHVAGVAALIVAQGVSNPDKVEQILLETASQDQKGRFNEKEYKERYGAGILQADAAVAKASNTPGTLRLALALLLSLFAFGAVRRKEFGSKSKPSLGFFAALIMTSAGLFWLPAMLQPMIQSSLGVLPDTTQTLLSLASQPLSQWESTILGASYHQNPLLASVLLPLIAAIFLGVSGRWKQVVAGISFGVAAYCLADAYLLTSDVLWIPGTGLLDRSWLLLNAVLSFALGLLALKKE